MDGVDKGLQPFRGATLAAHAVVRLSPQVDVVLLSANRHLDRYAALGVDVWPDTVPDFAGPLAGILAGLENTDADRVAVVPCDAPRFPLDLVARLDAALDDPDLEIAVAASVGDDGTPRLEPAFLLLRRALAPALRAALLEGERKAGRWIASRRHAVVAFADVGAFANVNTIAELHALEADG